MQVVDQWLSYWHGDRAEEHQAYYYRCFYCRRLIAWTGIRKGGCPHEAEQKLSPAKLSRWEKLHIVCTPWWGVIR